MKPNIWMNAAWNFHSSDDLTSLASFVKLKLESGGSRSTMRSKSRSVYEVDQALGRGHYSCSFERNCEKSIRSVDKVNYLYMGCCEGWRLRLSLLAAAATTDEAPAEVVCGGSA